MSITKDSQTVGVTELEAAANGALNRWAASPTLENWQEYCRSVGRIALARVAPCRMCGGSGVMPGTDWSGLRDSCPGCHDGPTS